MRCRNDKLRKSSCLWPADWFCLFHGHTADGEALSLIFPSLGQTHAPFIDVQHCVVRCGLIHYKTHTRGLELNNNSNGKIKEDFNTNHSDRLPPCCRHIDRWPVWVGRIGPLIRKPKTFFKIDYLTADKLAVALFDTHGVLNKRFSGKSITSSFPFSSTKENSLFISYKMCYLLADHQVADFSTQLMSLPLRHIKKWQNCSWRPIGQ